MHNLLHGVHRHTLLLKCIMQPLCLTDTVLMYTVHCTIQLAVFHSSETHLCEPQLLMTSHGALNSKATYIQVKFPSLFPSQAKKLLVLHDA